MMDAGWASFTAISKGRRYSSCSARGGTTRGHLTPLRFLFVAGEVLRVRVNAVGLDALDLLNRHHPGQVRVLALVFVIASAIGMTMQVHPGREHHLVSVAPRFIAQDVAQLTVEFWIERGRARWRGGQPGRKGLRDAVTPADTRTTVDHAYGWDRKFGNPLDVTSDLRNSHPGGRFAAFSAGRVSLEICSTFCSRVICGISRSARCSGLRFVFIHGRAEADGDCAATP